MNVSRMFLQPCNDDVKMCPTPGSTRRGPGLEDVIFVALATPSGERRKPQFKALAGVTAPRVDSASAPRFDGRHVSRSAVADPETSETFATLYRWRCPVVVAVFGHR
jgi:hypothetical protein